MLLATLQNTCEKTHFSRQVKIAGMGNTNTRKRGLHRRAVKSTEQPAGSMSESEVVSAIERAAVVAGIDPAWTYAMKRIGKPLTEGNMDQWSEDDWTAWGVALKEYRTRNRKAS